MSLISFSLASLDNIPSSASKGDRFIPSRNEFEDFAESFKTSPRHSLTDFGEDEKFHDENKIYRKILKKNLNLTQSLKKPARTAKELGHDELDFPERKCRVSVKQAETDRKIPSAPFKVLDAPNLKDDFYLNVVDWSQSDLLAVGLGSSVFTYGYQKGSIENIVTFAQENQVSAVNWDMNSDMLGVGTVNGTVQLWDAEQKTMVTEIGAHTERVGALSLRGPLLLTGSRDKSILLHDLRVGMPVSSFPGHKQEVCGLKWSPDGQYFASGGNDKKLFVF